MWLSFYSFLSSINYAVLIWLLFISMGINIGFLNSILVFFPGLILSSLPFSIGGWGLREAVLILLGGALNIDSSISFSISVCCGVLTMLAALPGAVFMFHSSDLEKQGVHA